MKSLLGGWELFGAVWKAKTCLLEDAEGWSRNCPRAATSFLAAICRSCWFLFPTYWFIFFFNFFIILYSPRLASFHFLMKSWFQVMWPSSGRSLVPCDLIQPYSYTSLLQEVFLLVKRRALRHQHVSRENALSWPNQPCLAGSSFPSWKTRLLPYCKLALAGVGRKPWQLSAGQGSLAAFPAVMHFTPKCTCYLEKRALLRRLCRVRGKEAAAVGFGRLCWGARAGTAGEAQPAVGASTKGGFAAAVPQCCF